MAFTAAYGAVFAAEGTSLDAARALEASAHPGVDFRDYASASLFVAVTDQDGTVAGAARLILPSVVGFKTLADAGKCPPGIDLARTWDVASFTVRPGARDLVTAALCHVVLQALRVNRVRTIVLTLDRVARETLATYGLLPAPIGGSPTALWGQVSRLIDRQRATNWEGYRLVTQGVGLDDVHLPAAVELQVRVTPRAGLSWARVLAPTG